MANIKRANASSITKSGVAISDVPDAPTIGAVADSGDGTTATVAYTAAVTGGTATTFTATSSPGGFTGTGSSPISVTGLSAGTAYTFTVRASNTTGTSPASSASSSLTLIPVGQFDSIATVTASGGETSLSFTSIPQTYKSLQIRGIYRDTSTSLTGQASIALRFNSDTTSSNYAWHFIQAEGSSVTAYGSASGGFIGSGTGSGSSNTLKYGANIWDIADYSSTSKFKTTIGFSGESFNTVTAADNQLFLTSHLWESTSAITRIDLNNIYTAFASGTTFALYGIRG